MSYQSRVANMKSISKQQAITLAICMANLAVAGFIVIKSQQIKFPENLRVFGSFWASGWAAAHHMNPYASYPLTWRFHAPLKHSIAMVDLNLSPPALLPFFQFLSLFDPASAMNLWTLSSISVMLCCVILMTVRPNACVQKRQLIWLLLCPSTLHTISFGQDYIFVMALVVIAFLLMEQKSEVAAGIFIGILVAAKPNYILWPLFLFIRGQKRTAIIAFSCSLCLYIFPVLLYGPGIYTEWLHAVANDRHWIFPTEISIIGLATRLNHRVIGELASVAMLVFSFIFVWRKRPSMAVVSGIALCVGTLAAPLAWVYYSLFLAPVLLSTPWKKSLTWAIVPLMIPIAVPTRLMHLSPAMAVLTDFFFFLPFAFLTVHFFLSAREVKPEPNYFDVFRRQESAKLVLK